MRLTLGVTAAMVACSSFADIKWASSYQAALHQAKAADKLLMVEFITAWDMNSEGQSGRMEHTLRDPKAQAIAEHFVPVRVDADKDGKELKARFHITNYPTVLFLDKGENVVGIIDGYEDPDEFAKHGNLFLKDHAEFAPEMAKYKKNPKDLDAIARLGTIYGDRYQIGPALEKLKEAEAIDPANKTDKLSDLYNAIADYYQNGAQPETAIKYFQKTADTSVDDDKRAYAYLSIAACYLYLAQIDPQMQYSKRITQEQGIGYLKAAIPPIDACLKLKKLKDSDRQLAVREKQFINQFLSGGGGGG
jgi:tetratricopeptide (TPR) repeat protein